MHYINGLWVERGSHPFASVNPAKGEVIWSGQAAGAAEVGAAVAASRAAFPAWAARPLAERLAYLRGFADLIKEKKQELTELIARETGKALWDAASEVAAVASKLTYTEEAYHERTGTKSKASPVGLAALQHAPHGVMAVFGPYNFPAHLPNGHIMPALLAGNTVVFKPSEQTPQVAEWVVKQWEAVGLPAGVLNLIQGERETGKQLIDSEIDGVLFTGSCATGKAIHAALGGRPEVLLALEMGGNNPLIVLDYHNLQAAVLEAVLSAYTGTGQRCTCARRLIVLETPENEAFIAAFLRTAATLTVGAYTDSPAPFMGPLISMAEATRLLQAQAALEALGGTVRLRMQALREGLPFVSPGVVEMTGIKNIPDAEYFGPLVQLYRAKTVAEAVALANQTRFGLSASVFCRDKEQFQSIRDQLRAGLVNWNRQTTGASGAAPFGGAGISGNHRPAGYYAADYCAYPVASVESEQLTLPDNLPPGITL